MRIIVVAGPSASGKTTICEKLAASSGMALIRERDIIEGIIVGHGHSHARECLAKVGPLILLEEARIKTANAIKSAANEKGVILDGAYDREMPSYLKVNFPEDDFSLVAVAANRSIRRHWMEKRSGFNRRAALKELRFFDAQKRRLGESEVIVSSDIRLRHSGKSDEMAEKIMVAILR